jgi:hypothetical protein
MDKSKIKIYDFEDFTKYILKNKKNIQFSELLEFYEYYQNLLNFEQNFNHFLTRKQNEKLYN